MGEKTTPTVNIVGRKELLTVREVADYLRVSRVTVWRWCQQGFIPAFRLGRGWRIRNADLIAFEETLAAAYIDPKDSDAISEMSTEEGQ